ncbi:MAG TPA: glycosyltransferase [Blastocatellia bacterium]|nr:glycosyltransferase [Blastocatellia bacterium]
MNCAPPDNVFTREIQSMENERDKNRIIQGLWIGPELSIMEQLSITSFLQNGHEYHLYTYSEVRNIPRGTTVKDASEVLPSKRIFQYKEYPTYAGFSNFFRYKLLLERGGWWVDTDTICLRPFEFEREHVFSSEMCRGAEVINSGIIKAPAGSEVMAYAWAECDRKNTEQLVWGETGPRLMAESVRKFGLESCTEPYFSFCPLGFAEWKRLLEPDARFEFEDKSYAIHLWNERWRASGQDKDGQYDLRCLYERLKCRYLLMSRGVTSES